MVGTKWQNTLIVVMEWLTRLAYINILWLLFTLAGLVVFGFGPATNAMFALMRKWLLYPEEDVPVWKTFYRIYRSEFVRSNVLTSIVFLLGVILYFDQAYFGASEKIWFQLAVFVVWGLGLAFVVMLFFLFPIHVHFDLPVPRTIGYAFMIGISHPVHAILIAAGVVLEYLVLVFLPGMIFFFGASFPCFIVMWITSLIFEKIDERKNETDATDATTANAQH